MKTVGDLRAALASLSDDMPLVVLGFDGWGFNHPDECGVIEIAPYAKPQSLHSPEYEAAGTQDAESGAVVKAFFVG